MTHQQLKSAEKKATADDSNMFFFYAFYCLCRIVSLFFSIARILANGARKDSKLWTERMVACGSCCSWPDPLY